MLWPDSLLEQHDPEWWSISLTYQQIRISSNHWASCLTAPWVSPLLWVPVRITWIVSFFSYWVAQTQSLFPDLGARVRAVNSKTPHRMGIIEAENEWTRPRSSLWISVRRAGIACHRPVELYLSHRFVQIWVSIPRLSNTSSLHFYIEWNTTHKEPVHRLSMYKVRTVEYDIPWQHLRCFGNNEW